ncbi:MAG: division/cell wall cluster transcriptional repressor MraZ [Sphingomonadaceae bacterium]
MELLDFFTGKWLNTVDAKGRVSVPAPIRKVIAARMGEPDAKAAKALMLAKHERDQCMQGFDKSYLALAYQDMRAQQKADVEHGRPADSRFVRSGSLFGSTEDIAIDGSGRIILPPGLRRRAAITDGALFVGTGETFEIWSPEAALQSMDRPDIREFAEELIAEREGRL